MAGGPEPVKSCGVRAISVYAYIYICIYVYICISEITYVYIYTCIHVFLVSTSYLLTTRQLYQDSCCCSTWARVYTYIYIYTCIDILCTDT